jgi:hypothetical protein
MFDQEFRDEITTGLENEYQVFLKEENLTDNTLNRIAFYIAGKKVVNDDPADDPEFQQWMLDLLDELLKPHLEKIAKVVNDALKN